MKFFDSLPPPTDSISSRGGPLAIGRFIGYVDDGILGLISQNDTLTRKGLAGTWNGQMECHERHQVF
jgi:hypothetical protein